MIKRFYENTTVQIKICPKCKVEIEIKHKRTNIYLCPYCNERMIIKNKDYNAHKPLF
ncbi:MAG: hypothetical protein WCV90_09000 [Candidatus Woesearchaeota archaeon]|jgi:predicted RNA-binding Zn-ribbon protein involved in translation (DUF1610 family)